MDPSFWLVALLVAIVAAGMKGMVTNLAPIALDEGTASLGPGVVVGEIDQARALFVGGEPLLDAFATVSGLLPADARTLLAKFGLKADHVLRPAASSRRSTPRRWPCPVIASGSPGSRARACS